MPTSLTKRSTIAVQRLNGLRQQKEIVKRVDFFKQRRDELAAEQRAFLVLAQKVRLFSSHGITVVIPKLVLFLQIEFSKIQTNFHDQPDSFTGANVQTVFKQSIKCREELAIALLRAWQEHVDSERLTLDTNILGVLSAVPSFREAVADLLEFNRKIENHRNQVPRNDEGFNALKSDIEEMQRIWNDLSGTGLPPEVLNFLRITGSQGIGAPLELLDKVRPWLFDRGLEASFRVVISG